MKSILRKLTLCALLGASTSAYAALELIPNGDFEDADNSLTWERVDGSGPGAPVTFATGGNPGGYGTVTPNGGWGILVSRPTGGTNAQGFVPIASLGLTAGDTATFTYDSINLTGAGPVGGFKWEAFNAVGALVGDTGNIFPTVIGTGTTWETYTYSWVLPVGTENLIFVPLWAGGGNTNTVGFDNIGVDSDPGPPPPPPPFVPAQIPNGDFEAVPLGVNWFTTETTPSYFTIGGNPGNFVQLTEGVGAFAVLYAFNNAEVTFASLGLSPGDTYSVQMDMKLITAGTDPTTPIGGLRLVGPAGFEETYWAPALIGDGTTWETYTFDIMVPDPSEATQARFGLRPGNALSGNSVAFDNVMIVLPAPAGPLQAAIAKGTSVSWTAPSETNQYQPQESDSISGPWTPLGSPIVGNTVTSVFDANPSPFYQVLESIPTITETAYNGNFSEATDVEVIAEGWTDIGSQPPTRLETGGRSDNGPVMQIKLLNDVDPENPVDPNNSEIQQNTNTVFGHENGEVVPGNTYSFSFWAKQISSGASYVQKFKVSFLNGEGDILGGMPLFKDVTTVGNDWTQVTENGLVAPDGATNAQIQIFGATGAVSEGLGEVLIDDVSLESTGFGAPTVLPAATLPAVEISWPSTTGQNYQVQSSTDLVDWPNFGGVISGNNTTKAVYDTITPPAKFYRVGELP